MCRFFTILFLLLGAIPSSAQIVQFSGAPSPSSSGPVAFTPLQTYFVAASGGSDANAGTSTGAAWVTAGHPVHCGDVIILQPGTYTASQFSQSSGVVTNCPSTSGGIDGTGGIYFAIVICGGTDVMACKINNAADSAVWVNQSNWAFEGIWATSPIDASNCFLANNSPGGTTIHHVAFINSIASTCGDTGFGSSGGGSAVGSDDQLAIVGVAAFNAANSHTNGQECGSAISIIPANGPDTSAGTHIYVAGVYLGHNSNTGAVGSPGCNVGGGHSDGEGIILDTWGAGYTTNGYLYQAVIENSLIWNSGGSSLQIFPQTATGANDRAQIFVLNNTMYAGDQDASGNGFCQADLHLHGISPNFGATTTSKYDIENNIVLATFNTCGNLGVNPAYALNIEPEDGAVLSGGPLTIAGNYIWNSHATTSNVYNATNNNVRYLDTVAGNGCASGATRCTTFVFGTNTYNDPGLASPTSLWSTAPDCTGFVLVTTCMLTKFTVNTFVAPSNAPTTIGYQVPGPCTTRVLSNGTNAFPSWLKGIVTLVASSYANGATITQIPGGI
jgi:hypothetical protein